MNGPTSSVYSDGEIDWNFWTYFDDITTIYTRYPDSTSSDDTLSNGKKVNESNVEALLEKKLKDIDSWDMRNTMIPKCLEMICLEPKGLPGCSVIKYLEIWTMSV